MRCFFIKLILVAYVRNKSHLSCSLYSDGKLTLVNSAGAGDSSGKNLGTLAYELLQSYSILVIDVIDLISAEETNLLLLSHRAERTLSVFGLVIHDKIPTVKIQISFL